MPRIHDVILRSAVDDVIKLVIFENENVNGKDYEGDTPLHMACEFGMVDMAKALIAFGADKYADNDRSMEPSDLCKDSYFKSQIQSATHSTLWQLRDDIMQRILKEKFVGANNKIVEEEPTRQFVVVCEEGTIIRSGPEFDSEIIARPPKGTVLVSCGSCYNSAGIYRLQLRDVKGWTSLEYADGSETLLREISHENISQYESNHGENSIFRSQQGLSTAPSDIEHSSFSLSRQGKPGKYDENKMDERINNLYTRHPDLNFDDDPDVPAVYHEKELLLEYGLDVKYQRGKTNVLSTNETANGYYDFIQPQSAEDARDMADIHDEIASLREMQMINDAGKYGNIDDGHYNAYLAHVANKDAYEFSAEIIETLGIEEYNSICDS